MAKRTHKSSVNMSFIFLQFFMEYRSLNLVIAFLFSFIDVT